MASITLEIDPKGQTKLEGEGFTGRTCQGVIDKVAKALGANTDNLQHEWKPEAQEQTGEQVSGG